MTGPVYIVKDDVSVCSSHHHLSGDILLEHQTLASVTQLARDKLFVNVERGEDRVKGQAPR